MCCRQGTTEVVEAWCINAPLVAGLVVATYTDVAGFRMTVTAFVLALIFDAVFFFVQLKAVLDRRRAGTERSVATAQGS